MYGVIKCICDAGFFAAFIACIFCTFRWVWISIRHREDMKARKHYSAAAFIPGAVSGAFLIASFTLGILQNG